MPTADAYLAAGRRAAEAFELNVTSIEVLSQSENVVLDVTLDSGEHVAMRLHRPGYNTEAELRSEVQMVSSLASFGVPVPTARTTTDGAHYSVVEIEGEARYVGVVNWVAGEPLGGPLDGSADKLDQHYHRIGELAAEIRLHNEVWVAPDGFARRRWDADGLVGPDPLWGRFWEVDSLTDSQRDVFAAARQRLFEELSGLSTGPDRFGLIHSDLHLGNLMANGSDLVVIDFDDAGFGWFAHELAVALHPVFDEPPFDAARAALVTGYRTRFDLSVEEEGLIDTFLTVRCLMIVGWLAARPELPVYEYLPALAESAEAQAQRYLAKP